MTLTTEQIREFYHRGYVKIPGAISKSMVDTARQAINYSIGTLSIDSPCFISVFGDFSRIPYRIWFRIVFWQPGCQFSFDGNIRFPICQIVELLPIFLMVV